MKKFRSVYKFLAFLLVISLLLPAGIAAKTSDGHDVRDTGTLTVHKYEQEPGAENGGEGNGSSEQTVPEDAKPLPGVEFTITMTHEYNPATDVWTEVSDGETFVGTTGSDGTYTFEDLPLGRYVGNETDGPAHVNLNPDPFTVDIPMTSKDGMTVNYDVHIYPKNETIRGAVELIKIDGDTSEPLAGVQFRLYHDDGSEYGDNLVFTTDAEGYIYISGLAYGDYYFTEIETVDGYVLGDQRIEFSIEESGSVDEAGVHEGTVVQITAKNYVEPEIEKEVDETDVNRGETVTYTLTIDLPGDIGDYNSFMVYDELDHRLSYVDGSWSTSIDSNILTFTQNGQRLEWTVNDFSALVGVDQFTISFDAQVAEDAEPNEVIDNKGYIEFENGHGNDGNKESDNTPLNPTAGKVTIIKVDGDDNGIKLDGAVFELRDQDGNVIRTGTTDSAGQIVFEDLDYGIYELVETKAPEGYNLLRNPIEIIVNEDNHDKTYTVNNYKSDWHLPRTGGIGTIPFSIVGLLIMGSAIYLYVRRRNQLA